MKKIVTTLLAIANAAVIYAATANDVQCADHKIPTNGVISIVGSRTYTALPSVLTVANAVPTNGTVTASWLHTLANGTVQTNSTSALQLVSGAITTNLAALFPGKWLYRGEPLVVAFSTATNGAVQVVFDLYGVAK